MLNPSKQSQIEEISPQKGPNEEKKNKNDSKFADESEFEKLRA